jgi:mRNA interferase MazF
LKPNSPEPTAGDIWDVRFDPVVGAEQGGIRPALVISSDYFNQIQTNLYFIAPITGTDRGLEYQISIAGREGGLSKNSVIMCDQARSASVQRFRIKRGEVSSGALRSVQQMVGRLIDAYDVY